MTKLNRGLFPTTVVGSMTRSNFVRDLLEPEALIELGKNVWQRRLDASVLYMISFMENTGIDIITDGEWRRRSYTDVIAQMTDGFVDGAPYNSNYHLIKAPLSNHKHFIAEEAKFVKDNTDRQVKICLPSPFILGQRMWHPEVSKKAYPSRREFVEATIPFLRSELEAVRDAGIDVAQIDEPHLSGFCDPKARVEFDDPDNDLDFLVDCLNQVIQGVKGITIALHICHFNRGRLGWVNEGGYEPIIPALNKLDVHQYTLEYSIPASGNVNVLKNLPEDRDVALGCVDCRSAAIDTPEQIVTRVETAMQFIDKERILLSPDCGFAPGIGGSIPLDESYAKLKNEVRAAEILRERYAD